MQVPHKQNNTYFYLILLSWLSLKYWDKVQSWMLGRVEVKGGLELDSNRIIEIFLDLPLLWCQIILCELNSDLSLDSKRIFPWAEKY